MFPLQQFAMNMINQSPNVQNNPMAKELIDVIMSGDSKRGEQMADNICKSHGMTREEGLKQASSVFGLKF